MNVTLFGATGMVGAGALLECLADPRVESILVVVRTATGRTHPKIREVLLPDFFDYTTLQTAFASCDACFFCLGVSAIGMSEVAYSHLTYDLTVAAATTMVAANPKMTFCYISGVGTDSTEHGRTMWARVKGKTENDLLKLPFKAAYMFRPAGIQPLHGVRSKVGWINAIYVVTTPLLSYLTRVAPKYMTTSERLGRAMIKVVREGFPKPVLESEDINRI